MRSDVQCVNKSCGNVQPNVSTNGNSWRVTTTLLQLAQTQAPLARPALTQVLVRPPVMIHKMLLRKGDE